MMLGRVAQRVHAGAPRDLAARVRSGVPGAEGRCHGDKANPAARSFSIGRQARFVEIAAAACLRNTRIAQMPQHGQHAVLAIIVDMIVGAGDDIHAEPTQFAQKIGRRRHRRSGGDRGRPLFPPAHAGFEIDTGRVGVTQRLHQFQKSRLATRAHTPGQHHVSAERNCECVFIRIRIFVGAVLHRAISSPGQSGDSARRCRAACP